MVPTPRNSPGEPRPDLTVLDRPRVGGTTTALRAKIHRLIEAHPERSVQVIRDWMTEGAVARSFH